MGQPHMPMKRIQYKGVQGVLNVCVTRQGWWLFFFFFIPLGLKPRILTYGSSIMVAQAPSIGLFIIENDIKLRRKNCSRIDLANDTS
jgi:hypothetical protein